MIAMSTFIMTFKYILVFSIYILKLFTISECLICSRNSESHKCRLTTITPYRFIADIVDDSKMIIPGCEAKKIWLLIRHGTRYPGRKILSQIDKLPDIQKTILNNCKMRNCPLNDVQRERLDNWNLTYSMNDHMKLTTEGENEMIALGERYQSRFPHLMPEEYSNVTYKFKFTASQRTQESAKHFAIGLFGKYQSNSVWYPEAEAKDPILRFYKGCDKWQRNVNENVMAYAEFEKFKNSTLMAKLLDNLSHRFNYKFDFDTAELIRKICGYETAWNESYVSPWCDFLTPEEFEIMEFIHDLKYYWIDGYGYELTYKHACPALIDIFNFFNSNNDVKTSAYFTHSGTILKVLSLLGLAKDNEPLLHDNYNTSRSRLWRTSLIDAFASNIAFVLYDCKSMGPSILVMHQERIIQLPGCPNIILCPISTMKENYPDEEKECDVADMCSTDT